MPSTIHFWRLFMPTNGLHAMVSQICTVPHISVPMMHLGVPMRLHDIQHHTRYHPITLGA